MKKVLWRILRLFSISLSQKHIIKALEESETILVFHRHKIFLSKIIGLHILNILFFSTYIYLIINYSVFSLNYILAIISLIVFVLQVRFSFSLYINHLNKRKTLYINEEVKQLINISGIKKYISQSIVLSITLGVDILITIGMQIFYTDSGSGFLRLYILEVIIFILIIRLNFKIIKIQLDFEMDKIIITPGNVKFIDREGFYTIKNQMFAGNQVQTIEILQEGRLDSLLNTATLRIGTSRISENESTQMINFSKIDYSEVVENTLHRVIHSKKEDT